MKNANQKLSGSNYARLTARDGWRDVGEEGERAARRAHIARAPDVIDVTSDPHSEFFLAPDAAQILSDEELASLDAMLTARGLSNLLRALESLLKSRIDEETAMMGRNLYHLMREDAHAYAAEAIMRMSLDPRIAEL